MSADDRVIQTIDTLYEAALEPDQWVQAMSSVGALVNGRKSGIEIWHGNHASGVGTITAEDIQLMNRWGLQSLYKKCLHLLPIGRTVLGQALAMPAEVRHSVWYDEITRRIDIFHLCGLVLNFSDEEVACCAFSTWRGEREPPFEAAEAAVIDTLAPHLGRAVRIASFLERSSLFARGIEAALAGLSVGVVLLDAQARVFYANPEAERLLTAGPVRIRAGRLRAPPGAASQTLDELLAAAQRRRVGAAGRVRDPNRAVQVLTAPLPQYAGDYPRFEPGPTALVILIEDGARPSPPVELIRKIYGLTPAEARLAVALMGGERLADYAERRRLSMNTIKTQLRAVYDKTDARRQSELMRKLAPFMLLTG